MCLFITAVLPLSALPDRLIAVAHRHQLRLTPCANPHVLAQLRPAERHYFVATRGCPCDCGNPLFFGSEPASPEAVQRQAAKLRKKGWSGAKIERWLASTSVPPPDPNDSRGGHHSVNGWADFLDDALTIPRLPYFALLGHWCNGDMTTEDFRLQSRMAHTVAELRDGGLGVLARDAIHEFRPGPAVELSNRDDG